MKPPITLLTLGVDDLPCPDGHLGEVAFNPGFDTLG